MGNISSTQNSGTPSSLGRNSAAILAVVAAATLTGSVVTGLTIGSTTITSTMAAKLERVAAYEAWPEDFIASTTDGGAPYAHLDGGIDGGAPVPVYPNNGTVDWTAAIQAAMNSMRANCGTVRLKPTAYLISAQINQPACVKLKGEATTIDYHAGYVDSPALANGSVLISAQENAFNFLKLGNGSVVDGVNFDSTSPFIPLAGRVIDFSYTYGVIIRNVHINRAWHGIAAVNSGQWAQTFTIENVLITNVRDAGIYFDNVVAGQINHVYVMNLWNTVNNAFYQCARGIHMIHGCATIKIYDFLADYLEDGIRIAGGEPGAWTRVADDNTITDSTFDVTGRTALAISNAVHTTVQGCHFISGTKYDVYMEGASTGININNNVFSNTGRVPISLTSADLVATAIVGNTFMGSAWSGSAYNVIDVAAGVSYFDISHNTLSLPDAVYGSPTGQAAYFVNIATGASNHFVVEGNVGSGGTGVINDGSSGEDKYIRNP